MLGQAETEKHKIFFLMNKGVFGNSVIVSQIALCLDFQSYYNFSLVNKFVSTICLSKIIKDEMQNRYTFFEPAAVDESGKVFFGLILKHGYNLDDGKLNTKRNILYSIDERKPNNVDIYLCPGDYFDILVGGHGLEPFYTQSFKVPESTFKRYKRSVNKSIKLLL